ncbi:MAG: RNA polymerase Rpb4 [Candidatus Bathyarchaeota archaeon]
MPEKIAGRKEITIAEAKQILEKLDSLNPFQARTLDYARKFVKIDPSKANELVEKLIKEFEIDRKDAIEVVNCMPTSIEELRVFFSIGRKRLIITAQLEKMLELLKEYM